MRLLSNVCFLLFPCCLALMIALSYQHEYNLSLATFVLAFLFLWLGLEIHRWLKGWKENP